MKINDTFPLFGDPFCLHLKGEVSTQVFLSILVIQVHKSVGIVPLDSLHSIDVSGQSHVSAALSPGNQSPVLNDRWLSGPNC